MFIDTHMHVADEQFAADRDAVLAQARAAGVKTMVEIAESPATWEAAVRLADAYPFIYASVGIHPHHAHEAGPDRWPELEKALRHWLKHPKVVALGEFGLDYFRLRNTIHEQAFCLRKQLELARVLKKPIVLHCRDDSASTTGPRAHEDLQTALREFYPDTSASRECPHPVGVVHCFSGTWPDAQTYLMHGFLLGIDGPVSYPSAKALQQNVQRMPLERLVLETDSPYLPPQQRRGQRNDPGQIPVIAEAVATLKHRTTHEVAERTSASARALFRLPSDA